MAIFLCGIVSLFLWQANIYPVLGLGNETINNVNNQLSSNSIATAKVVVQRGENLWVLAQKYQTTVDELVKLNQIKVPDQIREGQALWVPNRETKEKSEDFKTLDVKEYSKGALITSRQASEAESVKSVEQAAGKTAYISWWTSILRNIPAFATVYKQGYNTTDSNDNPLSQPRSIIQTYEIMVNEDTELPEEHPENTLAETKAEHLKHVTEKPEAAASSGSQIHSRGLGRLVSQEEVELLSRVIYGEARGEDFLGQVAVGAVVLNRVNDPRFPKTIKGVIYESGAFTAVDDRQIHLTPNDQAYKAAEAALSGLDPTNGAIFYYNPRTATDKWIKSRTVIKRIGNHTFSI
ncbi:putative cell wall hydrolase [Desulfosporosinus youngiae DSM 17734]|uniref:Putative cell wall hydrolase n=1 Tax=Desulfosporosinus youngiae DSM 17734 TaxID=768710 RepID=H5Y052_9FIRM|nr:putative cell wall hydrolase [Desulfosporosinus youngiae DSM 17734]